MRCQGTRRPPGTTCVERYGSSNDLAQRSRCETPPRMSHHAQAAAPKPMESSQRCATAALSRERRSPTQHSESLKKETAKARSRKGRAKKCRFLQCSSRKLRAFAPLWSLRISRSSQFRRSGPARITPRPNNACAAAAGFFDNTARSAISGAVADSPRGMRYRISPHLLFPDLKGRRARRRHSQSAG